MMKNEKEAVNNLIEDLDGYNDSECEMLFTKALAKRIKKKG